MTAAFAMGAPAAARTWQHRRDEDLAVQVWRLIANAGPKGIAKAGLREKLNNVDDQPLTACLQDLRRKGHARYEGVNGSTSIGTWVATPMPWPDEPAPAWISGLVDTNTDEPLHKPGKDDETVQAARQVPASVFALGELMAAQFGETLGARQAQGQGVDIDAAHMPAEHRQALADAAPPATAPQADAPAPIEATAVVTPLPAQAQFYLTSDNWLVYRTKLGRVVTVPPEDTRLLFSYLDRLATIGQTERLQAVL